VREYRPLVKDGPLTRLIHQYIDALGAAVYGLSLRRKWRK
jgi:hypothetical protein